MRKLALFLMNNIVINQFLILIKKDHLIKKYKANWTRAIFDNKKSLQENVGFSHAPHVEQSIQIVHDKLQKLVRENNSKVILDIGCGTGLYLKDFKDDQSLYGTDLSSGFIEEAQKLVPNGHFFAGDFMKIDFSIQFDLIFSISVIEYIHPSLLNDFFEKVKVNLKPGGLIFIQYPHALSNYDSLFPDLSYVQYSPRYLEKVASRYFRILSHQHSYDERPMSCKFDNLRYDPEKEKSFRNGAIIIAKREE